MYMMYVVDIFYINSKTKLKSDKTHKSFIG